MKSSISVDVFFFFFLVRVHEHEYYQVFLTYYLVPGTWYSLLARTLICTRLYNNHASTSIHILVLYLLNEYLYLT